jgi:hypothetical protein
MPRVHLRLLFLVIVSACTDEGSASRPDGAVEPHLLDGGVHRPVELPTTCEGEREFFRFHRWCEKNSDCVIVGSCSSGSGFQAVERALQKEAQGLSDHTKCLISLDGPTYGAVCERGVCTARPTGGACGQPVRDGGLSGCPAGQEQYLASCETPMTWGFDIQGCETHCDGPADTSCGAGRVCTEVRVLPVLRDGCQQIGAWLCRPPS